jgi:hypothetical protein
MLPTNFINQIIHYEQVLQKTGVFNQLVTNVPGNNPGPGCGYRQLKVIKTESVRSLNYKKTPGVLLKKIFRG